jgi:type I restriction enzyme S subunit
MSAVFKHIDFEALPDSWAADHFGNLVDFKIGRTPPRGNGRYWKDGNHPWVSIADMAPHGIVRETKEQVSAAACKEVFRGQFVPAGSLLMSFKLTIGRVSELGVDGFHNEAIISFKPDESKVSAGYLRYFLSQIDYRSYQDTAIKGQTLNKGKISSLEIVLPPLPEQKKIAHILSTVQRAIEEQERIIQTTTELKKALMHKLFTEGLRNEPQKLTEVGLIPKSWEVVEIGDVFKFTSGKTKPKDTSREPTAEQTIPVYGGNGVLGYSAQSLLNEDVLILGRVGEYCGCAHLTKPISWVTDNALYAIEEKRSVNRSYARTHFEHLNLNQYSNKMGQPLITQGTINRVKFGFPSRSEQNELANAFETLNTRIAQFHGKRNSLQDLFRTLLHELMTARTRVS